MYVCACAYALAYARVCVGRDIPGGVGSMPSVTVTCFIVTNRGVGPKNTHVTRDIFYGRSGHDYRSCFLCSHYANVGVWF